ncbi:MULTISPECIES: hypothetical protein [Pseudomonas]|uniref:hypothetical protein n=1 Tax=Pseudomonas TaxID=286 RepID=UPI001114958E|nr:MULTISPECIES: hypothetical protein [Pseudomonas]
MANILLREGVEWRGKAQNCDIMQIFRIICKGLQLEIFLIYTEDVALCGASLLAMDVNDDACCLKKMRRLQIHREQARYRIAALLRWACFR